VLISGRRLGLFKIDCFDGGFDFGDTPVGVVRRAMLVSQ
jgi:hypothetical protein